MSTHSRVGELIALVSLSVLVAACPGDPPPNIPASLAPQTVTGAEITGPDFLAPGQTAQYTVTVGLSSFVSKLPTKVLWVASPLDLVRIDQSGVATGGGQLRYGGAAITAEITMADGTKVVRSKGVITQPDGTFALSGQVTDAEIPQLPVVGARVLVEAGKVEGNTDSSGTYRMYGVPPNAEVRIIAEGYHTLAQTLDLFGHGRQDFRLALAVPRLNLNGLYTLSIESAGGDCEGSLLASPDLRSRRYDATVTQTGAALDVRLTEPRFSVTGNRGNRFSGQVRATGAQFQLDGVQFDFDSGNIIEVNASIVERLPDGTLFTPDGSVVAVGSAAGLSGTLFGSSQNYRPGIPGTYLGSCFRPRFSLTPR